METETLHTVGLTQDLVEVRQPVSCNIVSSLAFLTGQQAGGCTEKERRA